MRTHKIVAVIAAAILSSLTLTACSTSSGPNPQSTTQAEPTGAPMDGDTVPTDEAIDAADEGASDPVAKLGETAVFPSGVTITVSAPEAFEPTAEEKEDFILESPGPMARFTITVTNGSSATVDMPPTVNVLANEKQAESILESYLPTSLDQTPSVTLLPGKTASWRAGWFIDDLSGDLTVEVNIFGELGMGTAYFTN
ncbi:MAG: hypothetical protein Q3979_05415 [Actinomycetaceae bacterium]|nr:hypothetical protein [Actinomycetaceae bacterium]